MNVLEIDNIKFLTLIRSNPDNKIKIVTCKRKAVVIPPNAKIIRTGNYLPHIKVYGTEYKYCPKCGEWITLGGFIKNKFTPDKLKDKCADCDNRRRRERYAKTKAVT